MGLIYSEEYQVPFYECDVNHNIKLSILLSIALQISGRQSLSLGVSDALIFEKYDLVWIVTDYDISIERLPCYNEKITIATEAVAYNKLFCYRNFYITGEDGQNIMTIHSTFILMDFKTRKVHPVLDEIVAPYQSQKEKRKQKSIKLSDVEKGKMAEIPVQVYDLDMNRHVNNGKYLEWFFDSLGLEFLSCYLPERIQLKYIKEIYYGSNVQTYVNVEKIEDNLVSYHDVRGIEGTHARSKMIWRKKENNVTTQNL